jgi:hypothetical protein
MTLDDDDIEQIARRVAELVGSNQTTHEPRYVDATYLAQRLGIDREWIYAHARDLGAIRLGGPRGRLRFDIRHVAELLASPDFTAMPARRTSSRRRGSRADRAGVIRYER